MMIPWGLTVPRLPRGGIAWVIVGAALGLAVAAAATSTLARTEHLERRIRQADSTAVVKTLEAVIWHRDKVAAEARANVEARRANAAARRADSLAAIANARRSDVSAMLDRAAASRVKVDTTGASPSMRQALADADALRLAVTPALEADAEAIAAKDETIAAKDRTIAGLHETIALGDSAFQVQSEALRARVGELEVVRKQHAPRCGRKCGGMIGAAVVVVVQRLPDLIRAVFSSAAHPAR
jgi:hypothetical protein